MAEAFCVDSGPREGLPVVFIHGFPFDHSMWEPQVRALEHRYRAIAYDVRGLGRSPVGGASAAMETLVDDLIRLLDGLSIPEAALCGLSMGGYIALRAAEREPARVKALILADTRSQADTETARQNRAAAISSIDQDGLQPFARDFVKKMFSPQALAANAPCVAAARSAILRNQPAGVCFAARAIMSRSDTTPALPRIRVPALVLAGEHDSLTPPLEGQAMAAAIPGARFCLIPGAGHLSSVEAPARFNRLLADFLDGLRR
ncbi:MAG: alpha/beta fold hydrolase [Elusimicrobia bacterium]|nr:alpha/beta fold hydrolase [Elusimicrobiota bacterium]